MKRMVIGFACIAVVIIGIATCRDAQAQIGWSFAQHAPVNAAVGDTIELDVVYSQYGGAFYALYWHVDFDSAVLEYVSAEPGADVSDPMCYAHWEDITGSGEKPCWYLVAVGGSPCLDAQPADVLVGKLKLKAVGAGSTNVEFRDTGGQGQCPTGVFGYYGRPYTFENAFSCFSSSCQQLVAATVNVSGSSKAVAIRDWIGADESVPWGVVKRLYR